jgi:hypothetical protein
MGISSVSSGRRIFGAAGIIVFLEREAGIEIRIRSWSFD